MFLAGYHGTTLRGAKGIISEGKFNLSDSDMEWLGAGIYFYFDINDAYKWRNSEAILHSVIKIENDEFLDIDTENGAKIYNQVIDIIAKTQKKEIATSVKYAQHNQCAVMKMLWETNSNIKVVAASFAESPTKVRTLLDKRQVRKEFCVRNNDSIKYTHLIRKEDIDG